MPTVIAILKQKGGSGKTTIATNFAHALKRDNYTVLAVIPSPSSSLKTLPVLLERVFTCTYYIHRYRLELGRFLVV